MIGRQLMVARDQLGLTRSHLAQIVGVGPSTVYRWEEHPVQRMDPLHRQLVALVLQIAAHGQSAVYGRALRLALKKGPMYAMHVMLGMAFDEWTPSEETSSDDECADECASDL